MEKADTLSAKGKGIVTFPKVAVKTPRGRYDLEICSNFMRMKGTQSSTITYDCITRLTKLQTVDEKDRILVVCIILLIKLISLIILILINIFLVIID